jgi:hypothetical protein
VTLTDLIPSLTGKPRPRKANRIETRLRKAQEHLAAVREDNAKLLDRQAAADDFFMLQDQYLTSLEADLTAEKQQRERSDEVLASYQADLDEALTENGRLTDELLALRARFGPQMAAEDNANRVTVPPMVRDTSAIEDQATGPIYVQTLWDALGVGPAAAVVDPGRVAPTWARSEDDTAPVPVVEPDSATTH